MRVLIWDFDGTLAWREGGWTGTLVAVANRHLPERGVTKEEIRPFLQAGFPWHAPERAHPGQSTDDWWAAVRPVFVRAYLGIGLEPGLADDLGGRIQSAYLDVAQWRVFDDVLPCLSALRQQGWTHCVLSNHVPELPLLVGALGLDGLFAVVSTSAQSGYEKPHQEAYLGLRRQFPAGSTVWMIGDNPVADVQGAERVGIPAILVRRRDAGATHCCDSLAGVGRIISAGPPLSSAGG